MQLMCKKNYLKIFDRKKIRKDSEQVVIKNHPEY